MAHKSASTEQTLESTCKANEQELTARDSRAYSFHRESRLPLRLLDAITVRLLVLVVICVTINPRT